jgi:hypothetical protein
MAAYELGGAVAFGFYPSQTDRISRCISGALSGKFAEELGVCRDIQTVTFGICLKADNLALALPLEVLVAGVCKRNRTTLGHLVFRGRF